MTYRTSRRQLLRTAGAIGSLGAAGCLQGDDRTPPAATGGNNTSGTATGTPTGTPEPTESAPEKADLSGDELQLPAPYNEWTRLGHIEVKGGGLPLYDLSGDGKAQYRNQDTAVYEDIVDEFQTEEYSEDSHWEIANVAYPGGQVRIPEDVATEIPGRHADAEALYDLVGIPITVPEFEFTRAKIIAGPEILSFYAFYDEGSDDVKVAPVGSVEDDTAYFECEFEGRTPDDEAVNLLVRDGEHDGLFEFDSDEDMWGADV